MRWFDRTEILVGPKGQARLQKAHVLVVGLGGVGGFAAESLVRAGIGTITIADSDHVSIDNRNRQLVALHSSTGRLKVEVLRERLLDINPDLIIDTCADYLVDDTMKRLVTAAPYDAIIDAIDTLTPKTQLILAARAHEIFCVSSMGAGAKLDPTRIRVSDISKSFKCPLAAAVRKYLSKQGVKSGLPVVFSDEDFDRSRFIKTENLPNKKTTVGTISYLPPIFGGFCASVVIRQLLQEEQQ